MSDRLTSPLRRPLLLAVGVIAVLAVAAGFVAGGGSRGTPHVVASQLTSGTSGPASGAGTSGAGVGGSGVSTPGPASAHRRPNIVFVLTDDLSMDLLRYMPAVQALESRGMAFDNYFVSDSLCCPSRASIFTGDYPHDTHVFTNSGPHGGMSAWIGHQDQTHTFNVALQKAGYRTAMMGKYINGYLEGPRRSPVPNRYIPPGWNEWDVAGWGYPEFNYKMNINGTVHSFGHAPPDYLTDVLTRRGVHFIDHAAQSDQPFFLELATFSPHFPYTPAPQDAHKFPGLHAPRPPSFDQLPTNPPAWLANHPPLTAHQVEQINRAVRLRAESVQSVDRMITAVEETLRRLHQLSNTYIVFSSDNGLHAGEYRMMPGKLTAFDTDIHVPLVVAGPGVPAGSSTTAMAENVDLADTFAGMGGTSLASDGYSLLPVLRGAEATDWRNAVLIEHHHPMPSYTDPDLQSPVSGNPPSYEAIRTRNFLYVEYMDGEREFYDLGNDPYELHNLADGLSFDQLDSLHAELMRLEDCHGAAACWSAGHVDGAVNVTHTRH
jgi:N-acetylglucosamine-6-sulfatase